MNHSSILQIHLNGGENSLSGGEHSIGIFSLASASSSASSLPLLSEGPLIKKRRNQGSSNRCAAWKAAAICRRAGTLSRIKRRTGELSGDLIFFGVSSESRGLKCHICSETYSRPLTFSVTIDFAMKQSVTLSLCKMFCLHVMKANVWRYRMMWCCIQRVCNPH